MTKIPTSTNNILFSGSPLQRIYILHIRFILYIYDTYSIKRRDPGKIKEFRFV